MMDASDYKHLTDQLPILTKKQMADLRARLLLLMGERERASISNADWILDGIMTVVQERGLGHMVPPNFRIRKNRSFSSYETVADRVRQLLDTAVPNMSLVEQRGMGVLAARALADYVGEWSEVSFENLLRNVGKIPEALDAAFPGYIDSGMLSFVLTSRREAS
jgi:hypothetical protein